MERDRSRHQHAAPERIITIGNKTIPLVRPDEGMIALAVIEREYLKAPPPAEFHLIVSPLVMWIWIGGLIVGRRRADRAMARAERGSPSRPRAARSRASQGLARA